MYIYIYIYIYISVAIWAQGAFQCSVAIDIEVELCTMDVQRKLRAPKVIQVGSDFSGMDSFTTALARILPRGKFNVAFQSDILKHARQMMMNKVDPLLKPDILYKNVWQRDENNVPDVHLYMWTPPCQSFSTAGCRRGVQDERGKLLAVGVKYVCKKKPRLAIMENVKGLTHKNHKKVIKGLKNAVREDYHMYMKVLRAVDFQIPQERERLFIVLIRKDCIRHKFKWPTAVMPRVTLCDVLDPVTAHDSPGRLPRTTRANEVVKDVLRKAHKDGVDGTTIPIAIDIDASNKFRTHGVDIVKTITRTRGGQGGPWISNRGRRTTVNELLKCQGFKPDEVEWEQAGMTKRQIGQLIGNSIPVGMLGHLLANAMRSAGLLAKPVTFPQSEYAQTEQSGH